ncbi:MAG: hypothetical protein V3T58_06035 [Candidatus Hydrothermarchaeales archaeon]
MKKMLLLILIGALMPFELVGASLVLSVTSEVTPSQMVPGSDGYIRLTITNIGDDDLPIVYVQLVSLDSPLVLENEADLKSSYIGGITAGGSTEKVYKFMVPPGTPSGTYAARYTVSQFVAEEARLVVSGSVLIPVQAPSSLIVKSLSPASFRPGERARVNITLSNTGDARLSDLVISWQTSGDMILPLGSDNKITVQSMEPGQEIVLPVEVVISPDIAPGVYPFRIKTTYYDQIGVEKTTNSTIGIVIERLAGTDISMRFTPSSFSPGEKAELIFDITNIGDSNLNDISISWRVKDDVILPLGLGNTMFVKSLKAGEHVQIPVEIIVDTDALPAIYPLSVEATYSDEKGIQKTDNFTLGVLIGGVTDFQVGVQEVSGRTTSLYIGNIGVNSARAISVSIPPQEDFSVIGPSEVFVGNLDPGDFTVASFQLVQKQRGNTLRVQIAYTDASGNRETLEKELTLSDAAFRGVTSEGGTRGTGIASRSGSMSGLRYVMIGILGLVGIAAVYLVWWRRKKQK